MPVRWIASWVIAGALAGAAAVAVLLRGVELSPSPPAPAALPDPVVDSAVLSRMPVADAAGRPLDLLAQVSSSVVLIDFWATWCAPCLTEIPDLGALSEDLPDELTIVGVLTEGYDPAGADPAVQRRIAEIAPKYPTYFATADTYAALAELLETEVSPLPIPFKLFLDPGRRAPYRIAGAHPTDLYRRLVLRLLGSADPGASPAGE